MLTPCSCTGPGFCERHKREKTHAELLRCRSSDHWRALWDIQAQSGDRQVCVRWERCEVGFVCLDCFREHAADNGAPPQGRPCVKPTTMPIFCSQWEPIGEALYRCTRCSKPYAALRESLLPKDRLCRPAVAVSEPVPCGGCGAPQPTFKEKVTSFVSAAKDFVASGLDVTVGEELSARRALCNGCKHKDGSTCRICGCLLELKQRERAAHCPMGFWPKNDYPWLPSTNDEWLKQVAVAIPTYGKHDLTHAAVADCFREAVHVAVIDSKGDYEVVAQEYVIRDGQKHVWGDACVKAMNLAINVPSQTNYLVLLNNDVRLSERFFSGLLVAQAATGAGIVAPCYSSGYGEQLHSGGFSGAAKDFRPGPFHREVTRVDGTCVLFTKDCLKRLGVFNLSVAPEFGWGLMVDMCIRARQAGIKVVLTEASYCEHLEGGCQTAKEFYGNLQTYRHGAQREMDAGLTKQWGPEWRRLLTGAAAPVASEQFPEITTRNLIYHITPFASNDVWLRNVRQLLKRIGQFNGKRVVAIATGEKMVPEVEVRQAFSGHDVEFILIPNDRRLRENASFPDLMEKVASTDQHTATFYAHAKGVATAGDVKGVTYWRNAMYHELLDYPEVIGSLLKRHPCVGTHRIRSGKFPDGLATGTWHYAGTFWWFRNDALFSQAEWKEKIPDCGWGAEAYPGIMFPYEDSSCVFMDSPGNSYDPRNYSNPIEDDEMTPAATDALRIELGGGLTPLGNGYVNVDRLDCADVRCDFDAPEFRLPFDDDSVSDVYSSHTFEHVVTLKRLLHEIVRVCRIGARVEIRVPHWFSNMAMCQDHKQTISHQQVDHWVRSAIEYWWSGQSKRLSLFGTTYIPGCAFEEWKKLMPHATDEQVMRLMPDGCHEARYVFHVVSEMTREQAMARFDEHCYLAANPDVAEAVRSGAWTSGREHYEKHGFDERRSSR